MDTLSRETTLSKGVCLPSEKSSSLKGKNLLPLGGGANSFLLEKRSFQMGFGMQESEQQVTKVASLAKTGRKFTKCMRPPSE